MLLPGDDHAAFPEQATNGGTETGLILAERLYAIDNEFGSKILFFSRATRPTIISKTKSLADRIGGFYLPKTIETQGKHFIKWLKDKQLVEGR